MSSRAYEDDGDAVIEMDLLPPRWLDVQDEITEHLAEIAKQTRKLDQLHQKHVLPGFDDEDVKKREEREIEQLTQEITRGFQRCQQAIKRIERMVREAKQQGNINQGEEVMAQNLKISLATRVGEVSAMFRKKQAVYLKSASQPLIPAPSASTNSPRTPRPRRLHLPLPLLHPHPKPLQRPRHARSLRRPLLLAIHAPPSKTTANPPRPQRSPHCRARARNRRHSPRHHRASKHLPGATNHGHRSGEYARPY